MREGGRERETGRHKYTFREIKTTDRQRDRQTDRKDVDNFLVERLRQKIHVPEIMGSNHTTH